METARPEPWEPRYNDSPDVAIHESPSPGFGERNTLALCQTLHAAERGAPSTLPPYQGAVVIRGMPALFPYQLLVLLECGHSIRAALLLSSPFPPCFLSTRFSRWMFLPAE